jgi:hypothetical protein
MRPDADMPVLTAARLPLPSPLRATKGSNEGSIFETETPELSECMYIWTSIYGRLNLGQVRGN